MRLTVQDNNTVGAGLHTAAIQVGYDEVMREMWQHRGIRLIFTANLVSMIGSGMNSAAVIWYILQATHSEVSLGALIALQTLPSLLLCPSPA